MTCLRERPNLTQEQKHLILETMSLATPDLFRVSEGSPEWEKDVEKPLKSLEQRAKAIFSSKDGTEIFAQIGKFTPMDDYPTCNCSVISDWCWWGSECQGGGCMWRHGCGTLWMYGCTGLCVRSVDH